MRGPVIITRAEPGAGETEARLWQLGYQTVRLPALTLDWLDTPPSPLPETEFAYIFTSANGVRAIQQVGWPLDRAAICVGPSTLAAAEAAGCAPLSHADGNSDDVFDLIADRFSPEAAPCFLHVANRDAAGHLVRRLVAKGFDARFQALYAARPTVWSEVRDGWPVGTGRPVLLVHSAKAAEAVSGWLCDRDGPDPSGLALVGISERALAPLDPATFAISAFASRPNENELIKALQSLPEPGVSSGGKLK